MDDRLKKLLTLVVEDVVATGEPVGSQRLVDAHSLDMSPATIRNWFVELETAGYIMQPHTSSGRVPTETGYRLYLDELVSTKPLASWMHGELKRAAAVSGENSKKMKSIAKTTAEVARGAVFLGLSDADTFYTGLSHLFAQPEFHEWSRVVTLGEVLDRLDDVLQRVRRIATYHEPTALIGSACPFGHVCGAVVLTFPDGTLVGLLGPMRMNYPEAMALLSASKELYGNIITEREHCETRG